MKLNSIKCRSEVCLVAYFHKMASEMQRAVIFWLWKKGNNVDQIYQELLATEGDQMPTKRTIYRWVEKFRCGVTELKDQSPPGMEVHARTDRNIERVRQLIEEDRRISIRRLAATVGTSTWTIEKILHEDLGLVRLCSRWVPRMLTKQMKARRVTDSKFTADFIASDQEIFCTRYVTMDECWLYVYDPETKTQSSVWVPKGSKPPVKFKVGPSAKKVLASIFWDCKGVIYAEYTVDGSTVTGTRFANSVQILREEVKKKRRGKLRSGLVLHMDNAPAHTSRIAQATIRDCGFELLPHPPYSPDLAPSDFWLFPNLKKALKGKRFEDTNEVIEAANQWFEDQTEDFYKTGVLKLKSRCEKCIMVRGDYVEKS